MLSVKISYLVEEFNTVLIESAYSNNMQHKSKGYTTQVQTVEITKD